MDKVTRTWGLYSRGEGLQETHVPFGEPIRPKTFKPGWPGSTIHLGPDISDGSTEDTYIENGYAEMRAGYTDFYDTSGYHPIFITQGFGFWDGTKRGPHAYVFAASPSTDDGIIYAMRDTSSWSSAIAMPNAAGYGFTTAFWDGASNKSVLIGNGATMLYHWPNTGGVDAVQSTGTVGGFLVGVAENYALLFGTVSKGATAFRYSDNKKIQWCAAGDVTDWDNGGNLSMTDGLGPCLNIWPSQNYFYVYRGQGVNRVYYVGGVDEWTYETITTDFGMFHRDSLRSSSAGCRTPYGYVFFTNTADIMLHRGGSEFISLGKDIGELLNSYLTYGIPDVSMAYDPSTDRLYIWYRTGALTGKFFSYHFASRSWSIQIEFHDVEAIGGISKDVSQSYHGLWLGNMTRDDWSNTFRLKYVNRDSTGARDAYASGGKTTTPTFSTGWWKSIKKERWVGVSFRITADTNYQDGLKIYYRIDDGSWSGGSSGISIPTTWTDVMYVFGDGPVSNFNDIISEKIQFAFSHDQAIGRVWITDIQPWVAR